MDSAKGMRRRRRVGPAAPAGNAIVESAAENRTDAFSRRFDGAAIRLGPVFFEKTETLLTKGRNCLRILFVNEQMAVDIMERDCGVWINILAHKIKKRLDAILSDVEITGVQSRIVHYIIEHCEDGPVFQRDVEAAFSLSRSTATGILQILEKNGMIRRVRVENDGRLKSLIPTEKAAKIDAQICAGIRETEAVMTKGISPGQMQLFLETAARMYDNLDGV